MIRLRKGPFLLMALLLGVGVSLPLDVQAAEYALWVQGVQVTDANASDVLGAQDGEQATVRYDAASNTLILDNADLKTAIEQGDGHGVIVAADSAKAFTVRLCGQNSITATGAGASGIDARGDVAVAGEGSLRVTGAEKDGISVAGNLTLKDKVLVHAEGKDHALYAGGKDHGVVEIGDQAEVHASGAGHPSAYGIYGNSITVKDHATVNGIGGLAALYGDQGVDISGGSVTAMGQNVGIAGSEITVSDKATVQAQGGDAGLLAASTLDITTGANVTAEGKNISKGAYGIAVMGEKPVVIDNATVTATGSKAGIESTFNLTLHDANVSATSEAGCGIRCKGILMLSGSSKVTAQGATHGLNGIAGAVVTDQAVLHATADGPDGAGMASKALMYIDKDAQVSAKGVMSGLLVGRGILTIDEHAVVQAESSSGNAITGEGGIAIAEDATVTANGAVCGISSNMEIFITGGHITARSGSGTGIIAHNVLDQAVGLQISDSVLDVTSLACVTDAVEVADSTITTPEGRVEVRGTNASIHGNVTLPGDVMVPQGATLTIPADATLTVPAGVTLTNKGNVKGDVVNNGWLVNRGTIDGAVSGDGKWGVASLVLNHSQLSLTEGDSAALQVTVNPVDAALKDPMRWTSSDADVVSVDENGVLKALKPGTATVSVQADDCTASCTVTVSEKHSGGSVAPSYTIDMPEDVAGGSLEVSRHQAKAGKIITVTVKADEGYVLDVISVRDSKGQAVTVKEAGEGRYTFVMPRSKVSVDASFVKEQIVLPFVDVAANDWYYDAVSQAYTSGLMVGLDGNHFGPQVITNRGMIVAMLYRMAGSPSIEGENVGYPFADVNPEAYYADAVYWARANGIISGYSKEHFGPTHPVTREQLAGMLMRYSAWCGKDVSSRADLHLFSDADAVSGWATDAMQWAVHEGLLVGIENRTLAPQGQATRAQVAAIFTRYNIKG